MLSGKAQPLLRALYLSGKSGLYSQSQRTCLLLGTAFPWNGFVQRASCSTYHSRPFFPISCQEFNLLNRKNISSFVRPEGCEEAYLVHSYIVAPKLCSNLNTASLALLPTAATGTSNRKGFNLYAEPDLQGHSTRRTHLGAAICTHLLSETAPHIMHGGK